MSITTREPKLGDAQGNSSVSVWRRLGLAFSITLMTWSLSAYGEILALIPYENKPAESLKSFKLTGDQERVGGIKVVDVDPDSPNFSRILMDMPLPPELGVHNVFYDRYMKKVYITVRGASELLFFNLNRFPYRLKRIPLPSCKWGQNLVFSDRNKYWYLSCRMSQNVIIGEVASNQLKRVIDIPDSYPHGLAVLSEINRLLVTSSASSDFNEKHDFFSVIELNTGKVLKKHRISNKKSSSDVTPIDIVHLPNSNPPIIYVCNMYGDDLWKVSWDVEKKNFNILKTIDFRTLSARTPLKLNFGYELKKLFVTTANPGAFHIFDIENILEKPKFVESLSMAEGANNMAFTKDGRYAFVQNSLLSWPGLSDGSITIIDLIKQEVVSQVLTFKESGLNPIDIVLLPEWNKVQSE